MEKFQPFELNDNWNKITNVFGKTIDGVIAMTEQQLVYDGTHIHDDEFESYSDYVKLIEPLFELCEEDIVSAALSYVSRFFYLKGLQDSTRIRDRLFKGVDG